MKILVPHFVAGNCKRLLQERVLTFGALEAGLVPVKVLRGEIWNENILNIQITISGSEPLIYSY